MRCRCAPQTTTTTSKCQTADRVAQIRESIYGASDERVIASGRRLRPLSVARVQPLQTRFPAAKTRTQTLLSVTLASLNSDSAARWIVVSFRFALAVASARLEFLDFPACCYCKRGIPSVTKASHTACLSRNISRKLTRWDTLY